MLTADPCDHHRLTQGTIDWVLVCAVAGVKQVTPFPEKISGKFVLALGFKGVIPWLPDLTGCFGPRMRKDFVMGTCGQLYMYSIFVYICIHICIHI